VPQPNATLINASSSCAVVSIAWVSDTPLPDAGCVSSLERVYSAEDLCGATNTVTQTVSWILNDTDPVFTALPADIDFACDTPAVPDPWVGVTATDFTTSNVVDTIDSSDPCLVTLTRTYTLIDCCGDDVSAEVVYTWIPATPPPTIAGPELIALGCIADAPPASSPGRRPAGR